MKPSTESSRNELSCEMCKDDMVQQSQEKRSITDDTDSLSNSFKQMKVADVGERSLPSLDDGYFSQSISSQDFLFDTSHVDDNTNNSVHCYGKCRSSDSSDICTDCDCSSNSNVVYAKDLDGDTQLHLGIIQKQSMLVLWFISLALSPDWLNITNRLLQTPLHIATIIKDALTTRRLMAAGSSVEARDMNGNTPLHIACREGHLDIVHHLLTPIMFEETKSNKYELPYQRIPQDLDIANYDGYTCLHLAAFGSHLDILERLLHRGAKVNCRERKSGRTALHFAAETNNIPLLQFLLRRSDIDVNAETYGGLTPLRLASGRNHTETIQLLLARGACRFDDSSDDSET
ncbi:NF-kappa-B inhibitor alpha-like [Haliotis rubra]|uniref:NF-kappa-B inhibitor alpha-like n=1 Tax=Haliotis rubra TaxID=36100 RepID=UPI001EE55095|nr:NF-kappa-B inhibitor alpha-like [Haliotis rubra]